MFNSDEYRTMDKSRMEWFFENVESDFDVVLLIYSNFVTILGTDKRQILVSNGKLKLG